MTSPSNKRPAPLSLRLTDQQREDLAQRAGDLSISAYIKSLLFGEEAIAGSKSRRRVCADRAQIAQGLAYLGMSQVPSNLARLAAAVHDGTLIVDADTCRSLQMACASVETAHLMFLEALGHRPPSADPGPQTDPEPDPLSPSLKDLFDDAARIMSGDP